MLQPDVPALILAPMEGVTDAPMRAVQGGCGAFTVRGVEFLRVSQNRFPPRYVFLDHVPELLTGAPDSDWYAYGRRSPVARLRRMPGEMAEAAVRRVLNSGAPAIDLNFGCPAPTVNRHDGGATLLRYPKRIREIVAAIRAAVPALVPVSAKLRLGWDGISAIDENATMAAEGGASWLTIHGRTRVAGYAPPIHWAPIGRVREQLGIPVVANGDIWTLEGFRCCREETGCRHFMLGRGALADPRLARGIATELGLLPTEPVNVVPTTDWSAHLRDLIEWSERYNRSHADQARRPVAEAVVEDGQRPLEPSRGSMRSSARGV